MAGRISMVSRYRRCIREAFQSPLGTELRAIQPSPYRAGLAEPRLQRLPVSSACAVGGWRGTTAGPFPLPLPPSRVGRQRGATLRGPFLSAPRRTALASFPRTRLSSDSCRAACRPRSSRMDGLVTGSANDQRFSLPRRHHALTSRHRMRPWRLRSAILRR